MSEDVSNWIIAHHGYKLDEKGYWKKLENIPTTDNEENKEWVIVSIVTIPTDVLFTVWAGLVRELSEKEVELLKLKEFIAVKSFEIEQETDFKELYGKNNAEVRKHHIKMELSDVFDEVTGLELGINWIRSYIPLLRECIKCKRD